MAGGRRRPRRAGARRAGLVRGGRRRDPPVGLGGVVGAEDRGSGDEEARPGVGDRADRIGVDPPSTSITALGSSSASRATFSGDRSMNGWPPQPGLTVMQRTWSATPSSSRTDSGGVPGLIAIPARQPASRIAFRVRLVCGSASSWTMMQSAPALAKSAICAAGCSIIRWTSSAPPASWT